MVISSTADGVRAPTTMQDLPFALLFGLAVAGVSTCAFALPTYELKVKEDAEASPASFGDFLPLITALGVASFGTVLFCFAWLLLQRACAANLVIGALVLPVVLSAVATGGCAYVLVFNQLDEAGANSVMMLGAICLVFTLVNACWLQALWHKIPATALALTTSSHVIYHLPGTMAVAVTGVVLQILWGCLAALAAANVYYAYDRTYDFETYEGPTPPAMTTSLVGMLLCAYWGWQVVSNLAYVATCGGVATWYFDPSSLSRGVGCCKPSVLEALGRACCSSFGSICAGSLLVAIVQTIGAIVRYIELKAREDGNLVFVLASCCLRCFVSCIESLLELFNEWAFVYVAIYGTSFATAGRAVFRLVDSHGLTTILTSLVADSVLGYGIFFASLAGTGCAFVAVGGAGGELVAAFLLSWLVGATCLSPVRAAIRTTLVCYAEAPSVLRSLEPKLHDAFAEIKAKSVPGAPTVQGVPVGRAEAGMIGV